jgi:hypothetical protein
MSIVFIKPTILLRVFIKNDNILWSTEAIIKVTPVGKQITNAVIVVCSLAQLINFKIIPGM